MRKQLQLLDVQRDRDSFKSRLHQFMDRHNIQTHSMLGESEEGKWLAVAMDEARQYGYGVKSDSDLIDVMMKVGRLLDESGCAQYGGTESKAVQRLCEDYLKIPFNV